MSPANEPAVEAEAQASRLDAPPPALVNLLASFHRLLKVARMYDRNNKALGTSAEAVVAATQDYCADQSTDSADLMFANETVFVNGRMLQMPRDVYERAMELGALLQKCDIANVTIASSATPDDLVSFVHTLGVALRDPTLKGELAQPKYGGVRGRPLRWRVGLEGEAEQSTVERVLRTYASAVVLMRQFHADLANDREDRAKVPLSIRRIAQRLVAHAEHEAPLLIALAASRNLGTDDAALAVTAALVAILMARQLTTDRSALTDLALAALLHDLGRRRLLAIRGAAPGAGLLSQDEKTHLAASDALASISKEGLGELVVARTVISFEAHWQTHGARLGALYGGKRPVSVLGRILSVARAFSELMAPGPHATTMGPEDAIQFLAERAADETQRHFIRLLRGGLAIFAAGTSVELSTGEIAVVTRVPENAADFPRPPVRILYDARGNALAEPIDVDLANPADRQGPTRSIRRALDMDAQQTQAMRAFVLSVTRGDAPHRERPPTTDTQRQNAPPPAAANAPAGASDEQTQQVRRAPAPATPDAPPSAPASADPSVRLSASGRFREPRPRFVDSRAEEGSESPRPVDVIAPHARPRTNPGPLPPPDLVGPRPRPRTNPGPLPPADIVGPLPRPRTHPGPLPAASCVGPPSRPRTSPEGGLKDALPPRERPRTNPGPLPREDPAEAPYRAASASAASRADAPPSAAGRSPRRERAVFVDPRSDPDEAVAPAAIARAVPAVTERVTIDAMPAVSDLARSAAPQAERDRDPRALGKEVHAAPTVARAWGDFEAEKLRPPEPAREASKALHAAPTVARSWGELEPEKPKPPASHGRKASKQLQAAPTVARAWSTPDGEASKPPPTRRKSSKQVHAAPTVARSWGTPGEDPPKPSAPTEPKPPPTRRKSSKQVHAAPTVARSWGTPGEDPPKLSAPTEPKPPPKRRPSTTRKADWGDYGQVVSKASPDEGPAARPTRRLKAEKGEVRKKTPDPTK